MNLVISYLHDWVLDPITLVTNPWTPSPGDWTFELRGLMARAEKDGFRVRAIIIERA